jgi:hypothetical protein
MFRQSKLFGLLFIIASCGQNSPPAAVKATNDSAIAATKAPTSDTTAKLTDTSDLKGKHEVYKEVTEDLPPSIAQFVLQGYTALDTTSGDLNFDQYSDMILVLKKNGEDSTSDVNDHPEKRPLLILLGQQDSTFRLAARNDNAVYCIDCGGMMGDPFLKVGIKRGQFSIEHYGGSAWRWTRTITFKFSPADNYWYLHKDGGESFHAAEPEKVTTKVQTTKDFGKMRFDKFYIYNDD